MSTKIQWSREFWQEWKLNPQATAKKYGLNWSEMERDWQSKDWKNISMDEFEQLWKKSKWAGWVDWS